jgi:hypothetical protein
MMAEKHWRGHLSKRLRETHLQELRIHEALGLAARKILL